MGVTGISSGAVICLPAVFDRNRAQEQDEDVECVQPRRGTAKVRQHTNLCRHRQKVSGQAIRGLADACD